MAEEEVQAWLNQRERHLQRRRALYRERRAAMQEAAPTRMVRRDSVAKRARNGNSTLLSWTVKESAGTVSHDDRSAG